MVTRIKGRLSERRGGGQRRGGGLRKQVLSTSPGIAWLYSRSFQLNTPRLPNPHPPLLLVSQFTLQQMAERPTQKESDG